MASSNKKYMFVPCVPPQLLETIQDVTTLTDSHSNQVEHCIKQNWDTFIKVWEESGDDVMSLNFFKKAIVDNDVPLMVRLIGMDKKDYKEWEKVEKKAKEELRNIKKAQKMDKKASFFTLGQSKEQKEIGNINTNINKIEKQLSKETDETKKVELQKQLDELKNRKQEISEKKVSEIREESKKEMDKMEEKRIKAIEKKAKRGLFDYLSGKTNNKILIVIRDKNAAALNDILKDEKQDITKAVDKKKNTALHYSLKKGEIKMIDTILEKAPDFINAQNDKGETALHIVSYEGKIDIVKRLLAKDADVSKKDKEGNTPLHLAVYKNHFDIVKLLLEKDDSLIKDKNNSGWTPFHNAVLDKKNIEMLNYILDKYTDIDINDTIEDGRTAMNFAPKKIRTILKEKGGKTKKELEKEKSGGNKTKRKRRRKKNRKKRTRKKIRMRLKKKRKYKKSRKHY